VLEADVAVKQANRSGASGPKPNPAVEPHSLFVDGGMMSKMTWIACGWPGLALAALSVVEQRLDDV
jgi:hypothetical protein